MKEDVLDVLMYLFEAYLDADPAPEPDRTVLRGELERAGFGHHEIDHALDWLDGLSQSRDETVSDRITDRSMRFYNEEEQQRLDAQCRGYVLHLEQMGILSPAQRERTIDRLMALGSADIDIEQIKWVVLMVLFTQPGQEDAYARMEDLVFEEGTASVH